MSGVRGDARKRAQESQAAPEAGLTEAEREALDCLLPDVDESDRRRAANEVLFVVARIKADAIQQERAVYLENFEAWQRAEYEAHHEPCKERYETLRQKWQAAEADLRTLSSDATETLDQTHRVHNHPPYRPVCNERLIDGQLRGACLNDGSGS